MKKGDFILIDFVGRVSGTGEIFDLTDAETAKRENVYDPKQKYKPALVITGAKMVIPGVEKQLEEMKPGDEREFSVKPEDAFGPRNPKLIKIISRAHFLRQKINPAPGIFVTIDRRQARIQSVSGGRVRADFNHPLAGKELHYRLKIVKQITKTLEKAGSLIEYYGIVSETSFDGGRLVIKTKKPMPDIAEKLIEGKIKEWIKEIKQVSFISEEKREEKTERPEKPAEKGPSMNQHQESP